MAFPEFMQWAFLGLVTGGVYVLWQMKESVSDLNSKIEVLIVRHEKAEQTIEDHEDRLRKIEKES